MDIKTIAGIISIAIAIGGLFVYQGQLIQRVEVLEKKENVDVKPLEQHQTCLLYTSDAADE